MILHRFKSALDRLGLKSLNENMDKIEKNFNNVVDVVANQAYEQVVDAARLEWKPPVDSFTDLTTTYPDAKEGWTSMARDTGEVYRYYRTTGWGQIQEISAGPFNEMDDRLTTQLVQTKELQAINLLNPPPPLVAAVGDVVVDDTSAIKAIVALGKNVYAPKPSVSYLLSDTITLLEGQIYFGDGYGSLHTFNFVDVNRDYFLVNKANSHLADIRITCNQLGDTYNSGAATLRNGAVNSSIDGVVVEDCPTTAFIAEEAVSCEIKNIISKRARRHGVYLIACDDINLENFKLYDTKLEPLVFRGKSIGVISGYRVRTGLINGYHEETTNWNAITLAQHPNQGTGTNYDYADIEIDGVKIINPFSNTGYGLAFYNNNEPLRDSKFNNISFEGVNGVSGFDLRKSENIELNGLKINNAYSNGINLVDVKNVKIKDASITNPVEKGDANFAGIMIGGTSDDITISDTSIIDRRTTKKMAYGIRSMDSSKNIKIRNVKIEGSTTYKVHHVDSKLQQDGTSDIIYTFTANNLSASIGGAVANANGGSGSYGVPVKSYLKSILVNINDLPTAGTLTLSVRKNGVEIETIIVNSTSSNDVSKFIQPLTKEFVAGDVLALVIYTSSNWSAINADISVIVGLATN